MQSRKSTSKEGLRQSIIARRQARLDTDGNSIKSELSPHERAKKERRKEQNRRAAQRCRFKKRQNQTKVLQTFQNILDSNRDLRDEMQILKEERDNLHMTWSSHCRSCPLFSPIPIKTEIMPHSAHDPVIKSENPTAHDTILSGIKQETPPPLNDCMLMESTYSPTGLKPDGKTFSPFAECQYNPHQDNYYTPPPPPQYYQHHHIHHHHHHQQQQHHHQQQQQQKQQQQKQQQQQQTPNNPPPPQLHGSVYPYPSPPNCVVQPQTNHQHPENTLLCSSGKVDPPCPPTPVSPSPKTPVPYQNHYAPNHLLHPNTHAKTHGYPNSNNKNASNSYQKTHELPTKSNSSYGITPSPHIPTSAISQGSSQNAPNTNLVSKYPDLCRHLQRSSSTANNHNVPFGKQYKPHSTPSPRLGNTGAISYPTHSPYTGAPVTINRLPNSKIQNASMPLSTQNPKTPDLNEMKRNDSNATACCSSNPGSAPSLESLGSSSDMETESVISTALDMETSYSLSRDTNKCIHFDVITQENIKHEKDDMGLDELHHMNQNGVHTPFSVSFDDIEPSPGSSTSDERVEEENGPHTQLAMADDLSDIPSKELLFFPRQTYEG